MVSLHSDAATVKRELTRLTRLNQQLQSNAMRDAEAHVDALSKAKEATRILEKKLSDARQEATHHCMKGRRLERDLEERKLQLDQILTRHKLYDAAAGGAQAAHTFDAAPPLPPVARLRPAAAPDAAAAAVVAVAQKRLAAAVAEAAARSREASELRAEVAKGRAEAEQRSADAERLYGLLLRASDTGGEGAELQAAAAAAAAAAAPAAGATPDALVQALHLQVSELQGELAVVRAAHEASEKAARDARAREADEVQLRAALQASEEEAAELRAALVGAEDAADAAEAAAAAAAVGVGGNAAADTDAAARRLQQVANLVADKEVLQRQLELLGAELLQARSESGGHLRALVAGQTRVNALVKEAAELRGRERAAAAAAAAAEADAVDARRRAAACAADAAAAAGAAAAAAVAETEECAVQTDDASPQREALAAAPTAAAAAEALAELGELRRALVELSEKHDDACVRLDDAAAAAAAAAEREAAAAGESARLYAAVRSLEEELNATVARLRARDAEGEGGEARERRLEEDLRGVAAERDGLGKEVLQAADDFRQMLRENNVLSRQLQEAIARGDAFEARDAHRAAAAAEAEAAARARAEGEAEVAAAYRQLCEEHEAVKGQLAASELEAQRAREALLAERRAGDERRSEVEAAAAREQRGALDLSAAQFDADALGRRLLQERAAGHRLQRELEEAAREAAAARAAAEAAERRALQAERERALAGSELAHACAQRDGLEEELRVTGAALAEEQRGCRRAEDAAAALHRKEGQLASTADARRHALEECKARAERNEDSLGAARRELDQLRRQTRALADENARLQARAEGAEAAAVAAQAGEASAQEACDEMGRRCEAAQATVGALDEQVRGGRQQQSPVRPLDGGTTPPLT